MTTTNDFDERGRLLRPVRLREEDDMPRDTSLPVGYVEFTLADSGAVTAYNVGDIRGISDRPTAMKAAKVWISGSVFFEVCETKDELYARINAARAAVEGHGRGY